MGKKILIDMKNKLTLIAVLLMLSAGVFAQTSLKGTWCMKASLMGMSGSNYMTFDGDTKGTVHDEATAAVNINIMGIKSSGQVKCTVSGTFVLTGDRLVINWDPKTYKVTKSPIEASVNGKEDASMKKELEEQLQETINDVAKELEGEDVYTNVRVKGDKLRLTSLNEKGKEETEKYTRVK